MPSPLQSNKRKAEEVTASSSDGKKSRFNENGTTALGAGVSPKPKAAIDPAILEKAKKAVQIQKDLREKLERLKKARAISKPSVPPSGVSVSQVSGEPERPHREERNEHEKQKRPAADVSERRWTVETILEPFASDHFDPSLGTRERNRLQRRPRPGFRFVEEGLLQRKAEDERRQAEIASMAERNRKLRGDMKKGPSVENANLIPLGKRQPMDEMEDLSPVPDVEWWDARILVDKSTYGNFELRKDRLTKLIEHPVLLDPPLDDAPPPPQPLRLTKAEMKKLRTQRRLAREQEKQELIRQGLLEPPKPKVKISNLMRVLGTEAAADPTAIEAEVRRQMAERAAAHEDRNLARMLTPSERREKKMRKLLGTSTENGSEELPTHVCLYKVGDLSSPQLRFKVEVNAKENHLRGMAVHVPGSFAVVAVEGFPKPLRRYEKLMLRRIKWAEQENEDEGSDEENYCHLVWSGVVAKPIFSGSFRFEQRDHELDGRRLFEEAGVAHYWDTVAAFMPTA